MPSFSFISYEGNYACYAKKPQQTALLRVLKIYSCFFTDARIIQIYVMVNVRMEGLVFILEVSDTSVCVLKDTLE